MRERREEEMEKTAIGNCKQVAICMAVPKKM